MYKNAIMAPSCEMCGARSCYFDHSAVNNNVAPRVQAPQPEPEVWQCRNCIASPLDKFCDMCGMNKPM